MDIIERLREPIFPMSRPSPLCTEAANEIEKLRSALVMVTETVGTVPLVTAAAIKAALTSNG